LRIELATAASQSTSKLYAICERNKAQIEKLAIQRKDGSETMTVVCKVTDVAAIACVVDELKALEDVQIVSVER